MPTRNDTTAPPPGAEPAPINRSPRAQPLPKVELIVDQEMPEERDDFFPDRPPPRVLLAYPNAKRHFGR